LYISVLNGERKALKVAVSATNGTLDSQVDPRFGRCSYFIIVDSETMEYEALPNMAKGAMSGAGIQAAQTIASKGVKTVLTGNVGPNASQVFSSTGIQVITGVTGTIREAVEKIKRNEIKSTPITPQLLYNRPNTGTGMGRGGGMGMGMGRGRGMGMSRWQQPGYGTGVPPTTYPPQQAPTTPTINKEQEIEMLKNSMKTLEEQLKQIKKRLEELKKK
jgi:predicted Fe-Mo cluster-binding NifX family protein